MNTSYGENIAYMQKITILKNTVDSLFSREEIESKIKEKFLSNYSTEIIEIKDAEIIGGKYKDKYLKYKNKYFEKK